MQGLSITYENEEQLAFVLQYEGVLGFDFMKVTRLAHDNIHVLVSAFQVPFFKKVLENHGIKYNVFINDFGKIVEEESISQEISRMAARSSKFRRSYDFSYFPRHKEVKIYIFLESLLKKTVINSDFHFLFLFTSYCFLEKVFQ